MFGRRSHQRFSILPSGEGVLRVVQDVLLRPSTGEELIVVGRQPGVVGDLVTTDLVDADSGSGIEMRIVESRPVIFDGTVRHRLRLSAVDDSGQDSCNTERATTNPGGHLGAAMSSNGRPPEAPADNQFAVLTNEFRVQVVNCSSSGCLLETRTRVEVGTVASLRLLWEGQEFVEQLRVVRCQRIEGAGSVYHVGAEFLWTDPPGRQSLRRAMGRAGQALSIEAPTSTVPM